MGFTPKFSKCLLIYVDKPPPPAKTQAVKLSGLPRSNLLPKTTYPNRDIFSDRHTMTIREDGITSTVPDDRVPLRTESGVASGTDVAQADQTDADATNSDA